MRLTKTATLKDLRDAAALQAWQMNAQLEKSDMSPLQRAYMLRELGAAITYASTVIVKEHNLKTAMDETKPKRPRKRAAK